MDIDFELNGLINKYGISNVNERTYKYLLYKDEFLKIVNSADTDAKVAIYGVGAHSIHVFKCLNFNVDSDKIIFIDDNVINRNEFQNYLLFSGIKEKHRVYSSSEAQKLKIKTVMIWSYDNRKIDYYNALATFKNANVIDPYLNIWKNVGYEYEKVFYYASDTYIVDEHISKYSISHDITRIGKEVLSCVSQDCVKEDVLKKLIYNFVTMHDFVQLFQYIDEYINLGYDKENNYINFKVDLINLLEKIKAKVSQKQTENCILLLVDTLQGGKFNEMDFTKKYIENGVEYLNAYTASTGTLNATSVMYSGRYYIEGGVYKTQDNFISERPLLDKLKEEGYNLKIYSAKCASLFPEEYLDATVTHYESTPELFWRLYRDIIQSEQKTYYMLHIMEYHVPFHFGAPTTDEFEFITNVGSNLCMYRLGGNNKKKLSNISLSTEDKLAMVKSTSKAALDYLDKQFEFYLPSINADHSTVIISGDHGIATNYIIDTVNDTEDVDYYNILKNYDSISISLAVVSNHIEKRKSKEMYDNTYFMKLVQSYYIEKKAKLSIDREFSKYELTGLYGLAPLFAWFKKGQLDEARPAVVICGENDRYVWINNDEERYFIGNDDEIESNNLINDPRYQERINLMRSQFDKELMIEKCKDLFEQKKYYYVKEIFENKNYTVFNKFYKNY